MDPLSQTLSKAIDGPVMVHSDILGMLKFLNIDVRKAIKEMDQNDNLLEEMTSMLQRIIGERDLWMPSYNYDFGTIGIYDIQESPSQVGSLTEFFRTKKSQWRTHTPMLSHCGFGQVPQKFNSEMIDPVGLQSNFHELVERNGTILFYGVGFIPTHAIYIERITGEGPLYRYDKVFKGIIIDNGESTPVKMLYHVRPVTLNVKYRMPDLFEELLSMGMIRFLPKEFGSSFVISAVELTNYWSEQLKKDPFYLLDEETKTNATHLVNQKGRRLNINDFEIDEK